MMELVKKRPGGRGKQSTLTQEETWQEPLASSPEFLAKQMEMLQSYKKTAKSSSAASSSGSSMLGGFQAPAPTRKKGQPPSPGGKKGGRGAGLARPSSSAKERLQED